MAKGKEYELAIKIAGEIEKSFYESTKLTKKELSDMAQQAAETATRTGSASSSALKSFQDSAKSFQKELEQSEPVFDALESTAKAAFSAVAAAATAAGAAIAGIVTASISAGSEFESAFAGVKKTVNATDEELEQMRDEIRQMAKEMPTSAADLSAIAESAGQLGIATENITQFTETMANMAVATNLTSDEAASDFAQFANVTGMQQDNFERLGSTVVALGNNLATTESDIVSMGMRLAAAGAQIGLTEDEIMGYAAALSSVGIEAEAGGTAFSKLMNNLQLATETGEDLNAYAKVAGMSASEFKKAFQEDASSAINAFLTGLNDTERNGKSAIAVLDDMGLTEVRLRDTLLRAANAGDMFQESLVLANDAWEENTALANEAAQRYETFESKTDILGNKMTDLGISIYDDLTPGLSEAVGLANEFVDGLAGKEDILGDLIDSATAKLPTAVREVREAGEAVSDFAEPFLAVGGWLVDNPGLLTGTITGIGSALAAYKVASGVAKLTSSLGALTPVGQAILGLGAVVGIITGIGTAVKKTAETAKKANLASHFGDIALSLSEMEEVAGYIIQSRELDQVREAVSALGELDGIAQGIEDTVEELDKANWKVSVGMELTEEEKEAYQSNIASFVDDVQEYVTQKQYAVNLAIGVLTDDDLEGSNIVTQVNNFYADKQQELADLGTKLNETVTEAFTDGLLDMDEAQEISQLQQQMAKIQSTLASSELEAKLDLTSLKYAGAELDAESFRNLQAELQEQVEEATADYEQAYTLSVANAKVMLQEGSIDQSGYDSMVEELRKNYLELTGEAQQKAVEFQTQAIAQQYADELESVQKGLQEALEDAQWTDNMALAWDPTTLKHYTSENISRAAEDALEELWEDLKPQMEQMQALAAQYKEAGEQVPEALSQGIADAAAVGVAAGDMDSVYTVVAEMARNSEEYAALIETMQEQGKYVPEEIAEAITDNQDKIDEAVLQTYESTQDMFNRVFGQNTLEIPVNFSAVQSVSTPYSDDYIQGLTGHAEGGIFDTPHVAWFAEDGPEAAIPLDGSQNAVSLWLKSGELMGLGGLGERTAAEPVAQAEESGVQIMYNPTLQFYGGTPSREDVEDALETEQERFARRMEQWLKDNRRYSFR